MASRTLPLLYLNLGGEMMYVLDQRLVAQNVDGAKAAKGQIYRVTCLNDQKLMSEYLSVRYIIDVKPHGEAANIFYDQYDSIVKNWLDN